MNNYDEMIASLQSYVKTLNMDPWWDAPSEDIPPWNKGVTGLVKDSSETKEKKRLAKLGKKRGPYKTSKKWDPETKYIRCEAMKNAWTPERREALIERNRNKK